MKYVDIAKNKRHVENKKRKTSKAAKLKEKTLGEIESGKFVKDFLKWIEEDALTEQNRKVVASSFFYDLCLIVGDLRIAEKPISGCAQNGKSLSLFLLNFFATEVKGLNTLFTFAKSNIRDKMVGATVKPLWEYNRKLLSFVPEVTSENNKLIRTEYSTAYWSYAHNPSLDDSIAVPAELQSISVDLVINDEVQNCDSRLLAVLKNRMDNTLLESKPTIKASTPGREGTKIDVDLSLCDEIYYAHTHCAECGKLASLHPEKCFLRQGETIDSNGKTISAFYGADYKIIDWYHHDPLDRVNSAYFACEHCGGELTREAMDKARLYNVKTKKSAAELHEEINAEPWRIRKIGLHVCPFLRQAKGNLAARFANEAETTQNPENYIQQTLGIPTSGSDVGLTIRDIRRALAAYHEPIAEEEYEKVTLVGVDQARSAHYAVVVDCFIPYAASTRKDKYDKAIRKVRFFKRVTTGQLQIFYDNVQPISGAFDLAPDYTLATQFCKKNNIIPVLQKTSAEVFRKDEDNQGGGIRIDSYSVNNQYFMTKVIKSFGQLAFDEKCLIRLPPILNRDVNQFSPTSPITHLLAIEFDEEKQQYQKSKTSGHRCDYFYSLLFIETALYHYIFEKVNLLNFLEYFQSSSTSARQIA